MKAGDKVSVVDDDLRGTILGVRGEIVRFEDEFGFVHESHAAKLVVHEPEIYQNLRPVVKPEIQKPVSKKRKSHLKVDLHFENLVENTQDYDAFERLFIQKQKLVDTVEFCRENNLKALEIVHGIGDGVLQKLVYDYLAGIPDAEFETGDFFYNSTGSVMVRFL